VQVRAVGSATRIADGAITKGVDVSNLNYLVNGTSALYVLYTADDDKFWFVWASDERLRLDKESSDWLSRKSVTLKFREELSLTALSAIHARVLQESRMRRRVAETLANSSLKEEVRFSIDGKTLTTTDSLEAFEKLSSNGLLFVTHGLARDVLRLYGLLTDSQRNEPKICAVAAYACMSTGQYNDALGNAGRALLKKDQLDNADLSFVEEVRDVCLYQLGRISLEETLQRAETRASSASGSYALIKRVDVLRFAVLRNQCRDEYASGFRELRSLLVEIQRDETISGPLKLEAHIHVLYAEGHLMWILFTHALTATVARELLKVAVLEPWHQDVRNALTRIVEWEREIERVIAQANQFGIPVLIAEALRTRLVGRSAIIHGMKFAADRLKIGAAPTLADIELLLKDANSAVECYRIAQHLEGELSVRMAIADLYEMLGEVGRAEAIAREIKPQADAMGYGRITAACDRLLSNTSIWKQLERELDHNEKTDEDVQWSEMQGEQMKRFAASMVDIERLPPDRFEHVHNDVKATRMGAIERVHWCRHLQLLQNLLHNQLPQTSYSVPCVYSCGCARHGYASMTPSPDARSAIDRFNTTALRLSLN